MLPPQCPLSSHVSHSNALSAERAVTGLSALGNSLHDMANRAVVWVRDASLSDDQAGVEPRGGMSLGMMIGLSFAIALVWNVGKFRMWERRVARVRAHLAQELRRPQRIQHRRNAIDEPAVGVIGVRELRFLAELGLAPSASVRPPHAEHLSIRQRDLIHALGARHGYREAVGVPAEGQEVAGESIASPVADGDDAAIDNTPWDESIETLEQRFPEALRHEVRREYEVGYGIARDAAELWHAATLSDADESSGPN
ncbi:hypothetical protein [Stenotrophomonas sp.]|uniref:hypothetical protein n=1 Tax=Stenotrophomonas sp. TaxID=69392 RepID=UPI0028A93876|nr:hypothetical protein [Stenotrophomonas sp.]